jgi:hypothetical protein
MNRFAAISVAAALAAPVVSFAGQPVWPAGAQKKDDAQVIAFYDGMCAQWADRNGLTSDAREAYLAKCRKDAAKALPVGYAEGGDGGDE